MDETTPPRPASTVLLLRDGSAGLEVYMQKRRAEMSFAASAHIFPGGSVDESDASDEAMRLVSAVDLGGSVARMDLGVDEAARRQCSALHVCAVREVVEESAVLLAHPGGGGDLSAGDAQELRRRLREGGDFTSEMTRLKLRPAVDDLTYVAHFITPRGLPRRYDTRFFVAVAPSDQEAAVSGGEASGGGWYTSASALSAADGGDVLLMPPTRILCAELTRHDDAASVIASLGNRPVPPIIFRLDYALAGSTIDHLPTAEEVAAMEEFE
jgi:8-oxo-dGTP pyrophosphatase MutT (NUDIX family)